jgi:hypothetical protein
MDPMKRTEYYPGFTIKGSAKCMINLLKISLSCLSLMYLGKNSELKFFSPILDHIINYFENLFIMDTYFKKKYKQY